MSEPILRDQTGAITTLTLNRPAVGNRMTNAMAEMLAKMIEDARDSQLVVLRGAGKDFCTGRNLPPPDPAAAPRALDVRRGNTEPVLRLYGVFRRAPMPVMSVVTGNAFGLGCALAAACDITVASEDARFQLPEMDHGIPPCLAISALMDRIPQKAISYLVYSREIIAAREALALGMLSKIVPAAGLEPAVESLAKSIADCPPPAVRAVKEFMRAAPMMEPQGRSDFASNLLANVLSSRPPARHS